MLNNKKVELLELAIKEGAITLEFGLEVYSNRSNVSRAVGDLAEAGLLIEKKPPKISQFRKVWTPSDKAEYLIGREGKD